MMDPSSLYLTCACTHTQFMFFFYKLVESPVFSHCNKKLCYNKDFSHLPFVVTQSNSPSSDQDTIIILPFYQQSTEHFFLSRRSRLRNQANWKSFHSWANRKEPLGKFSSEGETSLKSVISRSAVLFSKDLLYRMGELSPFDLSWRDSECLTELAEYTNMSWWAFLVGVIYLKGQLAVLDLLHAQT